MKPILTFAQDGVISGRYVALRPTKLCLTLLVLSVAMWVGAVNYQVNVAYLVCFWVVGLVLMSALLTRRQLLGLRVAAVFEGEVFAGQTAETALRFDGISRRNCTFWWRGEWVDDDHEDDVNMHTDWQRIDISGSLNAAETIWAIPIETRGEFPTPLLLRLATSAPFGLFQASCRVAWQSGAIAYAAPLSHEDFGAANAIDPEQTPQWAGLHGDDIAYLKAHQQGTSLQHIAWKVYAKRGEFLDKVFDEPPITTHSEYISYRDYPAGTSRDKLASLMTYRVLQAEQAGVVYTVELPQQTIAPQNQAREKALNALALM